MPTSARSPHVAAARSVRHVNTLHDYMRQQEIIETVRSGSKQRIRGSFARTIRRENPKNARANRLLGREIVKGS